MNMIKKTATIFLLLFFSRASFSLADEAVKKYPPYPDVWGVELKVSDSVTGYAGIDILKMDDGDYMLKYIDDVRYLKSEKAKDFDLSKHMIMKKAGYSIFRSKIYDIGSGDKYNEFMEKARKEGRIITRLPVIFSDGSSIKMRARWRCVLPKGDNPIRLVF